MFNLIHNAVDLKLIPGASSALITNDLTTTDIYGLFQYPDVPLVEDAIYDIASITKLFVSERIFQLLDEGKIELNDTVQSHLPDFKNSTITIRQCLIHKSGFAPSASGRYIMDKDALIESILNCIDLDTSSTPKTNYSCINFIVLGMMIEKIDGVTLDNSLEKNIFIPLELENTSYNPKPSARLVPTEDGTPIGVVHDETAKKLGGVSGNAGIFSTLDDLIKFTKYIMSKRIPLLECVNEGSRSLGWNIFNDTTLFHTGFTGPIIMIHNNCALIILTNRVHPSREDTGYLKAREEIMASFVEKYKK